MIYFEVIRLSSPTHHQSPEDRPHKMLGSCLFSKAFAPMNQEPCFYEENFCLQEKMKREMNGNRSGPSFINCTQTQISEDFVRWNNVAH